MLIYLEGKYLQNVLFSFFRCQTEDFSRTFLPGLITLFDPVGAIFQCVIDADFLAGQLTRFAQHQLPQSGCIGKPRRDNESPRLDPGDELRIGVNQRREPVDGRPKTGPIEQQGGYIAEQYARFGVIRNGADQGGEIGVGVAVAHLVEDDVAGETGGDRGGGDAGGRLPLLIKNGKN